MKQVLLMFSLCLAALSAVGCSTTGTFKIPPDTKLMVTNREAKPDAAGVWKTSPFFWAETTGAQYRLVDASGNVVRSGKLKTHFRVVSIFWPPAAIIYWPMGFAKGEFDLTRPGDGYMVTDDTTPGQALSTTTKAKKTKKKANE